ncbi:MAG: DUF4833 domain-containing protein [Prolixibacteraceae bacterium]|jgi:hypothetical protein|nr:DUF4833 domain-containing protein [Prolixibacteraceae bacterium]
MNKHLKTVALILCFVFDIALGVWASSNSSDEKAPLFRIGRNRDANEIWYTANFNANGTPDIKSPVNVFWLKKTAQNRTEPLTWIQRHLAYGIKVLKNKANEVKFQFVSYPNRSFVMRNHNNSYQVFTTSNNQEIIVERIFINISGGTFMLPQISQVELYGIDPNTGNCTIEIIKP